MIVENRERAAFRRGVSGVATYTDSEPRGQVRFPHAYFLSALTIAPRATVELAGTASGNANDSNDATVTNKER